ncbi:helix-turn-helix domain-containing protein [Providencia vermicola]|uniref:helix-turn-helix domain-containing protein n=1 Tax=Providencia vermicola TaxID=333965 RepID=UPI0035253476
MKDKEKDSNYLTYYFARTYEGDYVNPAKLSLYDLKDNINLRLGRVIKSVRKGKGLTEKELAAKLNISQQQLSRYERGVNNFNLIRIIEVMNLLDIEPDILIDLMSPYMSLKKKGVL